MVTVLPTVTSGPNLDPRQRVKVPDVLGRRWILKTDRSDAYGCALKVDRQPSPWDAATEL